MLERAQRAHAAMIAHFWRRGLYRRRWGALRRPEHLWPTARALVATLDLAGATGAPALDTELTRHLSALERYWQPPAYRSDPVGARLGGDVYYDDNAWVGLALVQLARLSPGLGPGLERAAELFAAAAAGWDERTDVAHPGGVFWVAQGVGLGTRNHDRNTVSNAPNAQLGLHLAELTDDLEYVAPAQRMLTWVDAELRSPEGLYWDKWRGDGSLDSTLWTYNQGSVLGAHVLLHRRGLPGHLARAEAIAVAALNHWDGRLLEHSPAFNAILLRNLLQLHAATADATLRAQIHDTLETYADALWTARRDRHDLFPYRGRRVRLLDQSAAVQVLALAAWAPEDYPRLA